MEDEHHLFSSEPAEVVRLSSEMDETVARMPYVHYVGHLFQNLVAYEVPVPVVDLLEIVDVRNPDSYGDSGSREFPDVPVNDFERRGLRQESGESVAVRPFHGFLELVPHGFRLDAGRQQFRFEEGDVGRLEKSVAEP